MPSALSRRTFMKAVTGLPILGAAGSFNIHVRASDAPPGLVANNERINRDRQAALTILKPTPRQLEHGLRHLAESLVFA
jgi:hypothetical protein